MSELLEQPRQVERDLSRAHWQRTIAPVVIRELIGDSFDRPPELSEAILEGCERRALSTVGTDSIGLVWARAYAVSYQILDGSIQYNELMKSQTPQQLIAQFDKFTFAKNINDVIEEGTRTQARFPISLAKSVSDDASSRGIKGFGMQNLNDVAAMIHQPYFREMVDTALITSNGFWRGFSTQEISSLPGELNGDYVYDFHNDGTVEFSPKAVTAIHSKIQEVNQYSDGNSDMVEQQSSSGCPARHSHTSFNTESDKVNLEMLSKYFGKASDELTQVHEQSVVQKGLDLMVTGLEKYSGWFDQMDEDYRSGRRLHPAIS